MAHKSPSPATTGQSNLTGRMPFLFRDEITQLVNFKTTLGNVFFEAGNCYMARRKPLSLLKSAL
jgi:hypothetical protein